MPKHCKADLLNEEKYKKISLWSNWALTISKISNLVVQKQVPRNLFQKWGGGGMPYETSLVTFSLQLKGSGWASFRWKDRKIKCKPKEKINPLLHNSQLRICSKTDGLSCPSLECCGVRDHNFLSKNPDILFTRIVWNRAHIQ